MLRHDLGYTGTHLGCEHGICGACTVLLDGQPVRACLVFGVQADGADVRTVEGLADGDELSDLQQAFSDHHALQCGFCTPGFLMLAEAYLADEPTRRGRADEEQVRELVASNLCRAPATRASSRRSWPPPGPAERPRASDRAEMTVIGARLPRKRGPPAAARPRPVRRRLQRPGQL